LLDSEELVDQLSKLALTDEAKRIRKKTYNMDPQQLRAVINAAVSAALKVQREDFENKLEEVTNKFTASTISAPEIAVSQGNMFFGDKQQQLHMNYSES